MDHVMELPEFLGVPVAILVVANSSVHWIELTPEYRALKNAAQVMHVANDDEPANDNPGCMWPLAFIVISTVLYVLL
jgi:hypothetical protein